MKITVYHHEGQAVPCGFSGYKIYPGRAALCQDLRKVFQFLNAEYESPFLSQRDPRQSDWIVLRRKYSGKKVQRKEPTVRSNSSEPSLGRYNGQEDSETRSQESSLRAGYED